MLITEAMVARLPKEEPPMPGGPVTPILEKTR
jgi:hypothetical protein